uniref:Uncharacterized protein n=1 Tax=Triticum urartu TaxID=4572 RepID=A0A8R7U1G0_TRIUA
MSLHACLASMARLKAWRSLNPKPPIFFVFVIFSQLAQCILFSLSTWLHQYLFIILLNSSHRVLVRSKQAMEYTGIACATALMRISFPPFDRSFSFHPWIFFHTLSFTYSKVLALALPT